MPIQLSDTDQGLLLILMFNLSVKDFKQGQLKSCSDYSMEGPKSIGPSEEALMVVWGNDEDLSLSRANGGVGVQGYRNPEKTSSSMTQLLPISLGPTLISHTHKPNSVPST